jgi:hypothetical protein
MKHLLAAALIALAVPAHADGWYFEASIEGRAAFWTFTNETGDVSPRRTIGNEIWITRTDEVNALGPNGSCDFENCSVAVMLDGHSPKTGERVVITFSNGEALTLDARGGDMIFDNFSTTGMGATNTFVEHIRAAAWVDIDFGGKQHRFNLAGSSNALDAIRPYLP